VGGQQGLLEACGSCFLLVPAVVCMSARGLWLSLLFGHVLCVCTRQQRLWCVSGSVFCLAALDVYLQYSTAGMLNQKSASHGECVFVRDAGDPWVGQS
jgi:hypothetical protein